MTRIRDERHPHLQDGVFLIVNSTANGDNPTVGIRILVVDDDPSFRAAVTDLLAERGFAVSGYAADREEAVAALQSQRPDAILLDIWLSGSNGLEMLRELRARDYCPPVLLTSSNADAVTNLMAVQLGAVGFVPKEDLVATELSSYFGEPHTTD